MPETAALLLSATCRLAACTFLLLGHRSLNLRGRSLFTTPRLTPTPLALIIPAQSAIALRACCDSPCPECGRLAVVPGPSEEKAEEIGAEKYNFFKYHASCRPASAKGNSSTLHTHSHCRGNLLVPLIFLGEWWQVDSQQALGR
ncbi:uncharacterized protein F4822DRAFT_388459 [Hypoxylon trugodes]|uniref:uncharacterized protein n=1 Tax=Hypoxylon trugodes TaxID=326681 RepID=UPI00219C9298|nr:uncharacterized protein F4822DRAFT_388459 [Hypoxylon trugodes]KAI1391799.1 hypothetical protein F4822DRAFT_388459 [Hypoxylon trugodes]